MLIKKIKIIAFALLFINFKIESFNIKTILENDTLSEKKIATNLLSKTENNLIKKSLFSLSKFKNSNNFWKLLKIFIKQEKPTSIDSLDSKIKNFIKNLYPEFNSEDNTTIYFSIRYFLKAYFKNSKKLTTLFIEYGFSNEIFKIIELLKELNLIYPNFNNIENAKQCLTLLLNCEENLISSFWNLLKEYLKEKTDFLNLEEIEAFISNNNISKNYSLQNQNLLACAIYKFISGYFASINKSKNALNKFTYLFINENYLKEIIELNQILEKLSLPKLTIQTYQLQILCLKMIQKIPQKYQKIFWTVLKKLILANKHLDSIQMNKISRFTSSLQLKNSNNKKLIDNALFFFIKVVFLKNKQLLNLLLKKNSNFSKYKKEFYAIKKLIGAKQNLNHSTNK